ncbi:MAG: hypothetical protein AVDCRST_MAG40-916, partial [uncultured Gemmatimonadaceae bacterium]
GCCGGCCRGRWMHGPSPRRVRAAAPRASRKSTYPYGGGL